MMFSKKFLHWKQAQKNINQSLQQKDTKRGKTKGEKIEKHKKPCRDVGHFLIQKFKMLISAYAWGEMLKNKMLVPPQDERVYGK